MMPAAAARTLYFSLQRLRGEPIAEALRDVRRAEFLSRDELMALQADRQRQQLRFARRHVPFYEAALAPVAERLERKLTWEQLDALLSELPIVEKGTPLAHPEQFRARNWKQLKTYPDKTSGSSGTPLIFPCDQSAWAYRHALAYRWMEAFGVRIGEPYGLFFGLHWNTRRRTTTLLRDRVFNRVRVSAFDIGPATFDGHFLRLRAARPTHLVGYPAAIFSFCALARERSVDLGELRLKAVFTTAEPLRPYQRQLIESTTGSRCVDVYGSAEGGLMAHECPAGRLHVCVETTWLTLRGTEPTAGEVIVTDMMLRAFPLIRYAMGDEVERKSESCSCGRAHPVLGPIEGRTGDWITLRDGRRLNSHIGSYTFKPLAALGVIQRYRFVQNGDGVITLWLVVTRGFLPAHRAVLEGELRKAFGDEEAPTIRIVDELPQMPNAKHRDFVRVAGASDPAPTTGHPPDEEKKD